MMVVRRIVVVMSLLAACAGCASRDDPADTYTRSAPAVMTGAYDFGLF